MVHPASHGVPRAPRYSGSCWAHQDFDYGGITHYAAAFHPLRLPLRVPYAVPQPRPASRPVWPGPRSLAATKGIAFAFCSTGYLDVSVRRVGFATLCIQVTIPCLCRVGFPIRKSPVQSLFGGSPRLIAAYHVLHRLPPPRHPPCALSTLDHITPNIRGNRPSNTGIADAANLVQFVKEHRARSARRCTQCRCTAQPPGGADRDRTGDLWLAKPPLSQLSYSPHMVGLPGFEPGTSRLSGVRSDQLSYRPAVRNRGSIR